MISFRASILIFGAVILACGSAGLLVVRWNNKLLKGLGWLGASFASGGAGAMLMLLYRQIPATFGPALSDLLILLAFVLLHVAILELVDDDSLIPYLGAVILALQIVVGIYAFRHTETAAFRIAFMSTLIAIQTAQTSFRLFREGKGAIRVPAWFCASILIAFSLFNFARAAAAALGLFNSHSAFIKVEAATFALFISVALGIAFAFFWMTTTMLSNGLEHIASTDPLTRLYNRRVFLLWCERELARSRRNGHPFSVLMMDLDHFKQINDTYGHQAGDDALCAAVERMQDSIRGIDILGRWGGEEFAAVLPNASMDAAFVVAERLRGNVEHIIMPVQSLGAERGPARRPLALRLTVSIGIATYTGPEDTIHAMLRRADASLYQAKAAGRNRVLADSTESPQQLSLLSA